MNGLRSQRRRDHTSPATSTNMARSPQPTGPDGCYDGPEIVEHEPEHEVVELIPVLAHVAQVDTADHHRQRHHGCAQPEAHSVGQPRRGSGAADNAREQHRHDDPGSHLAVISQAGGEGGQ